MDPNYQLIDSNNFESQDWTNFYGDVLEATPINAPAPRGKAVLTWMMVDSDHVGCVADCSSRICYLIYV